MKALKEAWFEFAGERSDRMGVEMISRPKREQPSPDGTPHAVMGRAGRLWVGDGGCGNGAAEVTCVVPDGDMDRVLAWLTGSGELRFSDEPDRMYRARVAQGVVRTQPYARLSGQQFTVRFELEPYRYLYPEADDLELTAPGLIKNIGTAPSQPRIVIEAVGDIMLTIADQTIAFEGLTDGVIMDCGMMECLNLAETALMNSCALMDAFPELPVGVSGVTWSGDVKRVVITPRWRFV